MALRIVSIFFILLLLSSCVSTGFSALEELQFSFRKVAENSLPVIVEIKIIEVISEESIDFSDPFEDFNKSPEETDQDQDQYKREYQHGGLGSGVIIEEKGNTKYVLTNDHVVGSASKIEVKLFDGSVYPANLIATDSRRDLAVISFESDKKVAVASLGDSSLLHVGDWVLALGSPLGYDYTVTAGIVSALGRMGGPSGNISDFIQTDAAINQGNSGGALVNLKGEVIGINTWIATQTGTYTGYGFAIPINNAKSVIKDFLTEGKVVDAWLGIQIPEFAFQELILKDLGLTDVKGALVHAVFKGSPAFKGGLRPGDYITDINNTPVSSSKELALRISDLPAGEDTSFTIIRQGEKRLFTLKLAIRAEDKSIIAQYSNLWPGLITLPITEEIKGFFPDLSGEGVTVIFTYNNTPADICGLLQDDQIIEINRIKIENLSDYYRELNKNNGESVELTIKRGDEIKQIILN
ncbi:MAG: trypsin-like peptidase domain-containing protein [Spirochaetales bacterium]|nr:trypsin-like peptidase domain-containing protein [Spirochaetales bacterium]